MLACFHGIKNGLKGFFLAYCDKCNLRRVSPCPSGSHLYLTAYPVDIFLYGTQFFLTEIICSSSNMGTTFSIGSPTTLVYDPSSRSTIKAPQP